MEVADEELDEQSTEIEPLQPRKRGRPKGSATKKIPRDTSTVGSTRYKNYYSGHHNKAQDTQAAWAWIEGLHEDQQQILDLTVYRDWPVLKMPLAPADTPKRKNPKSIAEQIPGTEAFKTDQDLVHRFGAGNYRVYVNENPAGGARRELFCAVVKATHDFRAFPPTDWRIDNIEEVDLADPSNGSYVAWLRSQGKIPDDQKDKQEKEEMTATAEVLGKVLDQNTAVMNRMLDEKDKQLAEVVSDPPVEPPSPEETLNKNLTLLEKLQNFTAGKPTSDPIAMVTAVIEAAKLLAQNNAPNPASLQTYIDRIEQLQDRLRVAEVDGLKAQLTDIRAQLAAKDTANPNVVSADGKNLETIVEKVVERFIDKPEANPWPDIIKGALPVVLPILNGFAQRMMQQPSPQQSFPMPPAQYQAGAPQAQLPAPAQPSQQPTPQAQPQAGGYTTGNVQLDALLMAITVSLADYLRDGESGASFAEEFIENQGIEIHTMLSQVGVDQITNIIATYPPLGGVMKKVPREKLNQFVTEFVSYKEQPAGGAA